MGDREIARQAKTHSTWRTIQDVRLAEREIARGIVEHAYDLQRSRGQRGLLLHVSCQFDAVGAPESAALVPMRGFICNPSLDPWRNPVHALNSDPQLKIPPVALNPIGVKRPCRHGNPRAREDLESQSC